MSLGTVWERLGLGRRGAARQRLCRHCSRPFRPERIGVVCRSESCGSVLDDLGRRAPRFFFAHEHGLWEADRLDLEAPCPFCDCQGRLASVCPHCRRPLGVERGEDRVIAVIGASASGKTHFLATVLHQLLDERVGRDAWHVPLDRAEIDRLRERLIRPLFEDLEVLPSTVDRLDEEVAVPLENRHDGRRVLLVFRDLGGELFLQPERLARVSFLRYAQGVVLMVDPLAFRPDAERDDQWSRSGQPSALEVLEVYRRVLETRERRAEEKALPLLPEEKVLAVAVTKADLVLPEEHPFWQDHDGAYLRRGYWSDRKEAAAGGGDERPENEAVARWVREHLDPRLVREADTFAEAGYFFVSSLGYPHPPGQKRLLKRPRPRRVHEPIFALLDRLTDDLAGEGEAHRPEAAAGIEPDEAPEAGDSRTPRAPGPDWGL